MSNNMQTMFRQFSDWFWDPTFWLPTNFTWNDVKRDSSGIPFYPDYYDLIWVFPLAVGLFIARLFWERFIALPIGRYFKVREMPSTPAVHNEVLEKAFRTNRKILPSHSTVLSLSKQTDLTARQIERWWRRRRVQGKPSEMQRFRETSWRFLFYITAFWGGLYVLWDKSWLWDTRDCWRGYPLQHVPAEITWYYLLELGFYTSLVLSLFMDVKRKDFWQMIIHHFATIALMVMSWSSNMVRIGTLVLCVHDAVDYFLEGGKMANYCKLNKLRDAFFVAFTVVWFLTRMTFFPLRILYSTLFESYVIIGTFTNIYYYYNGLLCTLQVLHTIWFYMILRMVYSYVFKDGIDKDERSDTEVETNSEDEMLTQTNGKQETMKQISSNNNRLKDRHHVTSSPSENGSVTGT